MDQNEMMEGESSEKLSKINSAALINLRLNSLWMDVHNYAKLGKYPLWNNRLDRVWCELAADVKDEGGEEKDMSDINKDISTEFKNFKQKKGFATYNEDEKIAMNKLYYLLMKKEIFLRRLQNKQGKGTAYEQSWDDYLDK